MGSDNFGFATTQTWWFQLLGHDIKLFEGKQGQWRVSAIGFDGFLAVQDDFGNLVRVSA